MAGWFRETGLPRWNLPRREALLEVKPVTLYENL
jgi:hypothetical protein